MTAENDKEFTLTRVFDAPLDLVWKAHSEKDRLEKWWGPAGLKLRVSKLDFRPGGIFHYCMTAPDGNEMWGKFVYREIVPQERIVFVVSFSDAQGNNTRHPLAPDWPEEILNIVTFSEQEGKTTLTLTGGPINATAEERKIYEDNFASLEQGFGGTYNQLEEYLSKA
jgi:uncharacterized protein YndB with AHSA1/START domain